MKADATSNRRNFLVASTLGAAVLAAAAPTLPMARGARSSSEERDGYRASPHILKYYKTTEV